jgi:ligand-binding sensor domain-containing protein
MAPVHAEDATLSATIYTTKHGLPAGPVREIDLSPSGRPYARTSSGWFVLEGQHWKPAADYQAPAAPKPDLPERAGALLATAQAGEAVAAGCRRGLFVRNAPTAPWREVTLVEEERGLKEVAALAFDTAGTLWFGAHEGLGWVESDKARLIVKGSAYSRATCAAANRSGVWFGTERGLVVVAGTRINSILGSATLPDNHVTSLASTGEGVLWVGTIDGVSRIVPPWGRGHPVRD